MSQAQTARHLEPALQRTESDIDASLRAAGSATRSLRRLRAVVRDGNLRELKAALSAARETADALQQQVATTAQHWDFDETGYFADGAYTRELLETAADMRVKIFEQDEQLYCYPSLVRVLPGERTLLIDRTRERRLRPSLVVEHLRSLQARPPRFRGQSGEYSRHEFARDLYLLDRSGITSTRDAFVVSFPASTGTKSARGVITAITETGRERRYWGIAFARED